MDSRVGNLILAYALKHRGCMQPFCEDLTSHFVSAGSPCARLVSQLRKTSFLDDVLGLASVVFLRDRLLVTATSRGEWEVLTHDATIKPLFSLIGQRKMAQDEGEAHALHTFLGKSGPLPGSSLQRTEG